MTVGKKWMRIGMLCTLCMLLTGCLFRSPTDLYAQPERSAGYEQLNRAISTLKMSLEMEFGTSVENAVIVSGDNTATIQLQDLDGDGERESALCFLRVSGVENAIKIYIFRQVGDQYEVAGIVEGDGTALYSVDYADLNGSGQKELVVNWQISTGVYTLGAYTLDDLRMPASVGRDTAQTTGNLFWVPPDAEQRSQLLATEVLLTSWSGATDGSGGYCLTDIDRDTMSEVAVVRIDSAGVGSHVELYDWNDGAMSSDSSVILSAGIKSLVRLRSNYVGGELYPPALYVSGVLPDGERVVDVLTYREDQLINLSMDPETGVSQKFIQVYTDVNLADINGDLIYEIPIPSPLPSYSETAPGNFWLINWDQYHENGKSRRVMTTYHNVPDSWYLEIPDSWKNKITISRNDLVLGQREVVFSYWRGTEEAPVPFLSIYRQTGTNRSAASTRNGRIVLREEGSTIYSAKLYDCKEFNCGLDEADLLERFHTIQSSWDAN